jgi:hypothetical protein
LRGVNVLSALVWAKEEVVVIVVAKVTVVVVVVVVAIAVVVVVVVGLVYLQGRQLLRLFAPF